MARPTLDRNVKFKSLCRKLALPKPYVRGLLETMWDCAHECGNPILGTAEDVEAAAEWPGEPGIFAVAVIGFVDPLPDGRFEIHDYWDHAPDYVKKRRQRELEREEAGAKLEHSADNGRQWQTTADNGQPPAPAPAPTPIDATEERTKRAPCAKFIAPTLDDIRLYCQQRHNRVDPEQWLAHYEANGWKVGRNAMKDWRAAVRTWERNDLNGKPKLTSVGAHGPAGTGIHPDDNRFQGRPEWDSYLDYVLSLPAGQAERFEQWQGRTA